MPIVPLAPVRREITVVNSRFVADLAPASSAEEARAFLAARRSEFPDARHHVPAWTTGGDGAAIDYCSDDGEPSGTAGRPLLAVLKGSGLRDAVIVVTRWFGGTLLGTGGLVKAYGDAGRVAIAAAERAELVRCARISIDLPYAFFDRARQSLAEAGAIGIAEEFAESVRVAATVPEAALGRLAERLSDASAGAIRPAVLESLLERVPLPPGR